MLLVNKLFNKSHYDSLVALALILLNPTIVLIDHGHFQYNCASLGLMQLAVYFILKYSDRNEYKYLSIGSFYFCLALNYKQMELYHALPFFFYLLSISFETKSFMNGFEFYYLLLLFKLSVLKEIFY